MRRAIVVAAVMLAGGCALQRAQLAQDARTSLVGYSKEQILACAGPPSNRASEGATEVWSYDSGGGYVTFSSHEAERRFCKVNLTMNASHVARVDYQGPTGGLLTPGEQCAYALEHCMVRADAR